ncbi:hypothetical protein CCO03_18760 [Comamonas serinivorans]|uniref:Lipoprotein n=1 Tax=Comamonas serinivorans TaxID=1082851 RepID=A0A1Y0ESD7_9BURK|nr:hypothetical protein [Comamonas serinivorans]ARU06428.1 hypothetical protein CCO03_18760 [Comamonas serinivorans]
MFIKPLLIAASMAAAAWLTGCGVTPQPSHGADNTPSGVSVYGTIDLGVGKSQGSGVSQRP